MLLCVQMLNPGPKIWTSRCGYGNLVRMPPTPQVIADWLIQMAAAWPGLGRREGTEQRSWGLRSEVGTRRRRKEERRGRKEVAAGWVRMVST